MGKSTGNTPSRPRTQSRGHGADDEGQGFLELGTDSKEAPNAAASDALRPLGPSSQHVGQLETWRRELAVLMTFAALFAAASFAFARSAHAGPVWALGFVLSLATALFALSVRQWLGLAPDLRCLPAPAAAVVRQMPSVICALVVLLQAAVVTFLVGLLVLLEELHPTMAVKLIVAGAAAFLLYTFATRVPRLWPTCLHTPT